MKKIQVYKVIQKDICFYSMVADPRMIAKIRKKYTAGEQQDVQRPWVENKVKEIAAYVGGKTEVDGKNSLGIIPNSPIINLKSGLKVKNETINGEIRYYVEFPESDDEIEKYQNQIEIIDGQHRIIAFDKDYIDTSINDNTIYEMNYSVFENITDNQRKELFMVTNEKQDKVETNLLRYIKKSLGLLVGDDEVVYDLLDAINNESSSPLYQRIMFGSNKIQKGYKENQLSKIFKQYGVKKFYDTNVLTSSQHSSNPIATFRTIISNYLNAWEECSNVSFQKPASDTITKISGLRYLFYIFPEMCQRLLNKTQKLTKDNFKKLIEKFPAALSLENVKCVFCDDKSSNSEEMEERGFSFRGEGATIALAKKDICKVIAFDNSVQTGSLI